MKLKMQGNAVLIKPDKLPEKTATGKIAVPKNSREMLPEWGTIVDCGPACEEVKKGMHVIFPRKQASHAIFDNVDYFFVYERNIKYYE